MMHIGGFFELELPHNGETPHPSAHLLNTGRACLMVMLEKLQPKRVWVPFYTCDATLEPFDALGIEIAFYPIGEDLWPEEFPVLGEGDHLLWTNYFGLCDAQTERLKREYGSSLLIDDTHAFFQGAHEGFWSFTTARKYFGVPDGAFLFAPISLELSLEPFPGVSLEHAVFRTLGEQDLAFRAYQEYEASLDCSVYAMSTVSKGLLRGVDLHWVAERRRSNFRYLDSRLADSNSLSLNHGAGVPYCYPWLPRKAVDRSELHRAGLYIPTFWPDVIGRQVPGFAWERDLANRLLPLPIDHRYEVHDLDRMVDLLKERL